MGPRGDLGRYVCKYWVVMTTINIDQCKSRTPHDVRMHGWDGHVH
jgi:hypothetical protein